MIKNKQNRINTFCPYCSNPTGRARLDFNTNLRIIISCENCSRSFAMSTGGKNFENKRDYLELYLEIPDMNADLKNLHCPLDGKKLLKYKSEAVYVDPVDEDVEMEKFIQCNACRRKFDYGLLTN